VWKFKGVVVVEERGDLKLKKIGEKIVGLENSSTLYGASTKLHL